LDVGTSFVGKHFHAKSGSQIRFTHNDGVMTMHTLTVKSAHTLGTTSRFMGVTPSTAPGDQAKIYVTS
jgi:hypothetical protein